jgi:hypothetical protein
MACECSIVALLQNNIPGIFSASIDGSTTVEISEDSGLILLGQTVSTLNIGAYAYVPGQDPFLGATCRFEASAQIPWITKFDCFSGNTYFIPKSGARASMTNREDSGISSSIISMSCNPGVMGVSLSADASNGPASPYFLADREDGFNLVFTGNPIPVNTGVPQAYNIDLGFTSTIRGFLQSFSLTVNPPDVAKVQYSFAFSGIIQ